MPKNNATCFNCGSPYYVCKGCIDIYSWKNVTCSVECFREYMKKIEEKEKAPTKTKIETETVEEADTMPVAEEVETKEPEKKTSTPKKSKKS